MMRLMVEAMGEAWKRPVAWAAGLGMLAGWCAVAWWWLGMGVGSAGEVALVALGAVALLGVPGWLVWRVRGRLRTGGVWMALPVAVLAGLGGPWLLVNWVPEVSGFTGQAVSAGIRFTLAGVCFVGAWLWWGRVGVKLMEEESHGVDAGVE